MSAPIGAISPRQLCAYADLCGWTLARAHAKSGNAALISGYLGRGNTFDRAIGKFALAYADQNERDHAALVAAVKKGRIRALVDEPQ
jgi:predicted alpha/beta hydrolase